VWLRYHVHSDMALGHYARPAIERFGTFLFLHTVGGSALVLPLLFLIPEYRYGEVIRCFPDMRPFWGASPAAC
jgi:hypothetical protein